MNQTDWLNQLDTWVTMYKEHAMQGTIASYIPALQNVQKAALGISIKSTDGTIAQVGDWDTMFTMQSVSKVVNFIAACETRGISEVLEKVDLEPTGDSFDSMIRLEMHKPGKPFNPMINAGAITVASMLPGNTDQDKFRIFMTMLERLMGRIATINHEVYDSEWSTAHRNRSIAHYLKGSGFLESEVESTLEVYIKECSVEVNTQDLASIGMILANDGVDPLTGATVISKQTAKITKSLMLTCGMYNASGRIAAFVGIPSKSGVSGAILSAAPKRTGTTNPLFLGGCGIGIYGPEIDVYGNSVAGVALLQHISEAWDLNVFLNS